ncbi:MAG: MOSC domain-containing protein, partial [Nocardioides sp.]
DGQFGENLTTSGLDVNEAEMGERWRIGGSEGPVLEVASFRTPCRVFQAWMGRSGYDDRAWVRTFAQDARPGPYLRVVVPGTIEAGDAITVVAPGTGTTVSQAFRDAFRV